MGKRMKRVNVVLLKRIPSRIPKGIDRNKLKEGGRVVEVAFQRSMTSTETMETITDAFKDLGGVEKLQFLQASRDNTLKVHVEQELDGNGVLDLAGCGSLYVKQMEESCVEPSLDLEPQASSSSTTTISDEVRRKELLQTADKLIKELRVGYLCTVLCSQIFEHILKEYVLIFSVVSCI